MWFNSHSATEACTMLKDYYMMESETLKTRNLSKNIAEGHTNALWRSRVGFVKATRWLHNIVLRVRCIWTRPRRRHLMNVKFFLNHLHSIDARVHTIITRSRRCWACKGSWSCSLRCSKRSYNTVLFFLDVISLKYVIFTGNNLLWTWWGQKSVYLVKFQD